MLTGPENAGLVGLFVAVAALTVTESKRAGLRAGNPAALYTTLWAALILALQFSFFHVAPLTLQTWALLLVGSGGFMVGSIVGVISGGRSPGGEVRYEDSRLARMQRVLIVALAAYVVFESARVLPVLHTVGGIGAILGGGEAGGQYRHLLVSASIASSEADFSQGSFVLGLLGYLLFVLGTLSLVWGGYFVLKRRWLLAVTPLILNAVLSLVTLQRSSFVYSLALFGFSAAYFRRWRNQDRVRSRRHYAIYAFLAAALVIVVVVPLSLRGPGVSKLTTVQSVTGYAISGVVALNAKVESDPLWRQPPVIDPGVSAPVPGLGVYTFHGLTTVLDRLHVPVPNSPANFDYAVVSIFGKPFYSNVFTWLIYFKYDLGWIGVALGPMLIALFAMRVDLAIMKRGSMRLVPVGAILMTTILMSFFGLTLLRDVRYTLVAIVGAFIEPMLRDRGLSQGENGEAAGSYVGGIS